jgi:hypothetical protein
MLSEEVSQRHPKMSARLSRSRFFAMSDSRGFNKEGHRSVVCDTNYTSCEIANRGFLSF